MEIKKSTTSILKVPDPVVVKNHHPVKALKVLQNFIVIGQDDGWIKTYDKKSLTFQGQ